MQGRAYGSLETFQSSDLVHVKETMKRWDWGACVLSSISKGGLRIDLNALFSRYNELEPTPGKPRFPRLDHCQPAPEQAVPSTRVSSTPEGDWTQPHMKPQRAVRCKASHTSPLSVPGSFSEVLVAPVGKGRAFAGKDPASHYVDPLPHVGHGCGGHDSPNQLFCKVYRHVAVQNYMIQSHYYTISTETHNAFSRWQCKAENPQGQNRTSHPQSHSESTRRTVWNAQKVHHKLSTTPDLASRKGWEQTYRAVLGNFHLPYATLCITLLFPGSKTNVHSYTHGLSSSTYI